jgi:hypothetical protein
MQNSRNAGCNIMDTLDKNERLPKETMEVNINGKSQQEGQAYDAIFLFPRHKQWFSSRYSF